MSLARNSLGVLTLSLCMSASGCILREKRLDHPDPHVKIPVILALAREGKADPDTLRQLTRELNSEDAAVRFYAINALEQLTGKRFGYDYCADETQRQASLASWAQFIQEQEKIGQGPQTSQRQQTPSGG